ncbi:MAG: DUF559 domain-containing protein [Armatimonadetes bacterium]|nr:DUF559 domain-containing protein [Armatimonadota bacterium]
MPTQSALKPRRPRELRDVLVVLWPQPKDRIIADKQGWYRIRPGRSATQLGDMRAFKQLLFYQPDSFGPERRRIEYSAVVRGYEKVNRVGLLPDEPDHRRADALYHCFRLEPLERLAEPIISRVGRRMLFVPTTRSRLTSATDINDLIAGNPIEDRLFNGLRESGLLPEREFWLEVPNPGDRRVRGAMRCLDMALFCRNANLNVECDGDRWHVGVDLAAKDRRRDNALNASGWHILRFGTADIRDALAESVVCVREAVSHYGGQIQ